MGGGIRRQSEVRMGRTVRSEAAEWAVGGERGRQAGPSAEALHLVLEGAEECCPGAGVSEGTLEAGPGDAHQVVP